MNEQKLSEAANRYSESASGDYIAAVEAENGFIAGARWHEQQNPWRLIENEFPPVLENKTESDLVLIEDVESGYQTAFYDYTNSLWIGAGYYIFCYVLRWKYIED